MKFSESAGGVVARDGLIVVVNQRGSSWSLPKGHIEKGETALKAAKREIFEEAGIRDLEFVKELGVYERRRMAKDAGKEDTTELKRIHMFLFRTEQKELKPVDPDNPEARWVQKEKVCELLTHPKDREFFKSIMDKID